MMEPQEIEDKEHEQVLERVAAVDVAKASGMVCTRVPHPSRPGRRRTRVWMVDATTNAILELAGYLVAERVEKVTLEATSRRSPWRPRRITCDVRVHEFKWEAPLEARLRPVVQYLGQCALARLRPGVRRG